MPTCFIIVRKYDHLQKFKKKNIPKEDNYPLFLNIPNQEVQVRVHEENRARLKPSPVQYQNDHRNYPREGQIPRQLWRCEKVT